METLKYKNIPPFQNDQMDKYCKLVDEELRMNIKLTMGGTRYTASTAINYANKMKCYLYFDNGLSPSSVEALTHLPHTTVKDYYTAYLVDNPLPLA